MYQCDEEELLVDGKLKNMGKNTGRMKLDKALF